jgi:hypothetical protein
LKVVTVNTKSLGQNKAFVLMVILLIQKNAFASVPEEFDAAGGNSLAFGGSVATSADGAASIRTNPGLLSLDKQYTVNGTYHWPTAGRDFYQLAVVDGKTSSVAAGFSYTGSLDQYQGVWSEEKDNQQPEKLELSKDTPVTRRAALAFSVPIGKLFLGAGGGYVEANPPVETFSEEGSRKIKGFTLEGGVVAHITQALRVGLSAENLANKKVQFAAPTYYRAGASYFFGDDAVVSLDFRRREAVDAYEGGDPVMLLAEDQASGKAVAPENLYSISGAVKVYDLLHLISSTGVASANGQQRSQASGGISITNQKYDFSYQAFKKDLAQSSVHHAVSLGLNIAL